jgi:hypothetical protein
MSKSIEYIQTFGTFCGRKMFAFIVTGFLINSYIYIIEIGVV